MSKLLKFEEHHRPFDLLIDYMLTFRCNYDCSYCISHDINHPLHKHSAKTISNSLNYLHNLYDNKKTRLMFLGGEPFLYKNLLKVVDLLNNNITVEVTTNLSISLKYIKEHFSGYSDKIIINASYHSEFADPDSFIEKLLYLKKLKFDITAGTAMHPDKTLFNKSIYVLDRLPNISKPQLLSKMGENNQIFGKKYYYTPQQLEILKKFSKKFSKETTKKFKATYDDKIKYSSFFDIVSQNLDNFKGMSCYAGHQKVHIKENGNVYPSACFLNTGVKLGNMFKRTVKIPNSVVTCPFTFCRCQSDLKITKEVRI